jgi:hypothetical protein
MNTSKKFWIILASAILGMVIIACSCGSISSLITPTQTMAPLPPSPTSITNIIPTVPSTTFSLPYYDDFSDPNSGWEIYDESFGSTGYANGYYYIKANESSIPLTTFDQYLTDAIVQVDATPVSGPSNDNYEYGISCRLQTNLDGYDFSISADGYFSVYLVTDGGSTFTSLLQGDEYQYSDAINQGLATNELVVSCNGSQLTFMANGLTLFTGQDNTFSDGYIGLFADIFDETTPAEVHFDDLLIFAP